MVGKISINKKSMSVIIVIIILMLVIVLHKYDFVLFFNEYIPKSKKYLIKLNKFC
jgi:hypothetical protein